MFPGVNPALISFVVKGQLDDLIAGKTPEAVRVKSRTDSQIHLVPVEPLGVDGMEVESMRLVVRYRNVEFILTNV